MSNVSWYDGCCREEEVVVFVSPITATVCGSFVGAIGGGGGGVSLTGFGFMCILFQTEQRTVVADEVFRCVIFLRAGTRARGDGDGAAVKNFLDCRGPATLKVFRSSLRKKN